MTIKGWFLYRNLHGCVSQGKESPEHCRENLKVLTNPPQKIKTNGNNILSLVSDSVSALANFACTLRLRSSYYGKMKWTKHVAYMGGEQICIHSFGGKIGRNKTSLKAEA